MKRKDNLYNRITDIRNIISMYDTRVRVNTKNKIKIEKFDEYYVSNITLQKAGAREATKAASLAPTIPSPNLDAKFMPSFISSCSQKVPRLYLDTFLRARQACLTNHFVICINPYFN